MSGLPLLACFITCSVWGFLVGVLYKTHKASKPTAKKEFDYFAVSVEGCVQINVFELDQITQTSSSIISFGYVNGDKTVLSIIGPDVSIEKRSYGQGSMKRVVLLNEPDPKEEKRL